MPTRISWPAAAAALLALAGAAPAASAVAVPTGVISTVAGTGTGGFGGDSGRATAAQIDGPRAVAWMPDGGFLIADLINARVRRVWPNGKIRTVAGTGVRGYEPSDEGGPATDAELDFLHGVAVLPDGDFVIADSLNNRIRHVSTSSGAIRTVAGNGEKGYRAADEGGPATAARLGDVRGIAATRVGILIADSDSHIVRLVSLGGVTGHDGSIRIVAGTPPADWLEGPLPAGGFGGDGGLATAARLNKPFGVAPAAGGGFLIADELNNRVRRVWPDGAITTVAGSGAQPSDPAGSDNGDGGRAVEARLFGAHSVVQTPPGGFLPAGGFLVAENVGNRLRYVSPGGRIATLAGTGVAGSRGDGGLSTRAELNGPRGLAIRPDGRVLIAEFGPRFFNSPPLASDPAGGDRIRMISAPRLVVRLPARLRARAGRAIRLRYTVSVPASVRVAVLRGGRRVADARARARAGGNRISLRRRLAPGRYRVRLSARASGGRASSRHARLKVTGPAA